MIYYIGGTSRSGKSSLAKKLLEKRRIPFMSTDFLDCFIENKEFDIEIPKGTDLNSYILKSEHLYSVLRQLLLLIRGTNKELSYTIEGDLYTPQVIAQLQSDIELSSKIKLKSCFLGFTKITENQRKQYLSEYSWMRKLDDNEIRRLEEIKIELCLIWTNVKNILFLSLILRKTTKLF